MKTLLLNFASVAVIFHLTFGCGMHHGYGSHTCAVTSCDHEHGYYGHEEHDEEHDHDVNDHHDQLPGEAIGNVDPNHHHSNHLVCCDDRCTATQLVQFEFESLDFSVPYLGGFGALSLFESQCYTGMVVDTQLDWLHTGAGVRAHLLLGVQLI